MRDAHCARIRAAAPRRLTGDAVIRLAVGSASRASGSQSLRKRNFALGIVAVILLALVFVLVRVVINPQRHPRASEALPAPAAAPDPSQPVAPVVRAVNMFSAFTLEQSATPGPDFDARYAADGLRLFAAVIDAFIVRDSLVREVQATTSNKMRAEADRIERTSTLTDSVSPTRAAFIAAAEIVTIVQRKNYAHLEQATTRLRDAARAIRLNRPLREQRDEIESFFQRASDAVQGMTAVPS